MEHGEKGHPLNALYFANTRPNLGLSPTGRQIMSSIAAPLLQEYRESLLALRRKLYVNPRPLPIKDMYYYAPLTKQRVEDLSKIVKPLVLADMARAIRYTSGLLGQPSLRVHYVAGATTTCGTHTSRASYLNRTNLVTKC